VTQATLHVTIAAPPIVWTSEGPGRAGGGLEGTLEGICRTRLPGAGKISRATGTMAAGFSRLKMLRLFKGLALFSESGSGQIPALADKRETNRNIIGLRNLNGFN
jgi:hypothetical protein